MRTLLIDNHDSYTYNLFHLIAGVNGAEPVVMRNDDPALARVSFDEFDNVVISPGPGHPGRTRDLGHAARFLQHEHLPVFGVCLGHQAIGLHAGAAVGSAPAPRHGHPTSVRHDGRELFAGLPQDFTAVRYHSLSVEEPLPADLEATAWAEDGVVMGLRHRRKPQWGVQFHPESILTEYGTELIGNFRRLSQKTSRPSIVATTTASPRETPAPVTRLPRYRLHFAVHNGPVAPEQLFTSLFASSPRAFWLDGAGVDDELSRFSYLGDDTGPLAEFCGYDVNTGVIEVHRTGQPVERIREDIFTYLRQGLATRAFPTPDLPFDFTCGYVGYFGYELKAALGGQAAHRSDTPDAGWLFADRMVVIDRVEQTAYALCLAEDSPAAEAEAIGWLDATLENLHSLPLDEPVMSIVDLDAPGVTERWLLRDAGGYRADIEKCQEELRAGESYEICLTTAVEFPAVCDSLEYYRVLRRMNPAPHSAYLRFGDVDVAGSSPERFLRVGADGTVEAKPIKGTARRGATAEEDAELRDRLASDAKTRAENLMIVDLLRNDLGQVCRVGTVEVPGLMETETYRTVHQLVSTVRGELAPGMDALDAIRACFPGGSMTGAPKERTMEIIDSLEPQARGVYSGALGFLSCNGSTDLSIVIRTAVFAGGKVRIGAGGAIVLDSDPEEEYREMLLKLGAPVRAYWEAAAYPPTTLIPSTPRRQGLRRPRRPAIPAATFSGTEAG